VRCATGPRVALSLLVAAPDSEAQTIVLDLPRVVIGRGAHADVRLPSKAVSDKHVVIFVDPTEATVLDEGSTNGTRLNGVALVRGRRKALRSGDVLGVGPFTVTVQRVTAMPDPPERTASLARRLLLDALRSAGAEASPPEFVVLNTRKPQRPLVLGHDRSRWVIGRGDGSDLLLDDRDCSRQHAEIVRDAAGLVLRDLGSKNGLQVGGRLLSERRLKHGDELTIGRTVLRFREPTEELLRAFEGGDDERMSYVPPPPPEPAAPDAETATLAPAAEAPAPTPAPAELPAPVPAPRADWIVVLLCGVILVVSAVALVLVLRPPR
jgi:pSer/pThr/pTyr-binding forkhead associated (FHA) protein